MSSSDPYTPPQTTDTPMAAQWAPDAAGPSGIRGWLLFYCLMMTLVGPLAFMVGTARTLSTIGGIHDEGMRIALLFETVGFSAIMLGGIVAGIILWTRRPNALRIIRGYLRFRLLGAIAIEVATFVLLIVARVPPNTLGESVISMLIAIGQGVIYFAIWWSYFKKSKRVANTFPAG